MPKAKIESRSIATWATGASAPSVRSLARRVARGEGVDPERVQVVGAEAVRRELRLTAPDAAYAAERRRGSESRCWEDVEIGEVRADIPKEVVWQTGEAPEGLWVPEQGVPGYRGRG